MSDPSGEVFQSWISNIGGVSDVRGNSLAYKQSTSEQDPLVGYYYLDPEPNFLPISGSADPDNFNFTLVAVDWRGLRSTKDFSVFVYPTPPELSVGSFTSNFLSVQDKENTLEYTDPNNEFEDWLASGQAVGFSGVNYNKDLSGLIQPSVIGSIDSIGNTIGPFELLAIPDSVGTHVVNFKVIDPRVENNPSWESDLTQDLNVSITVVSTLPVIQVARTRYSVSIG